MATKYVNAKIYKHDDAKEILVENGTFKAIGNDLPDAPEVVDLQGHLVLPPYVDPHLHLDYVYTLGEMEGIGAASEHSSKLLKTGRSTRLR